MFNPYEHIEQRLDKLESLLMQILERERKAQQEPVKQIFSIKEAAKYLNRSESCLYAYVNNKKIPFYKRVGRLYFRRDALDEWIKNGEVKTALDIKQEAAEFIRNRKKR